MSLLFDFPCMFSRLDLVMMLILAFSLFQDIHHIL